jgi:hypothetical protein
VCCGIARSNLDQFRHRLAFIEKMHRPPAAIEETEGRIDADGLVESALNLLHRVASVAGLFTAGAGSADGLSHL